MSNFEGLGLTLVAYKKCKFLTDLSNYNFTRSFQNASRNNNRKNSSEKTEKVET